MALYMAKEPETKLVPTWWEKDDDEYPPGPSMPPAEGEIGEPLGPTRSPDIIPSLGEPWGPDDQAPDEPSGTDGPSRSEGPSRHLTPRLVLETPDEYPGSCQGGGYTSIPVTMRIANFFQNADGEWIERPSNMQGLDTFEGEMIRLTPSLAEEDIPRGVRQHRVDQNIWTVPENWDWRKSPTLINTYTDWIVAEDGKILVTDMSNASVSTSTDRVRVWVKLDAEDCPNCTITFEASIPSRSGNEFMRASSRTKITDENCG